MYKFLTIIVTGFFILACKNKEEKKEPANQSTNVDSTLITDTSWGFIKASHSFEDLKKIYGEAAIKDERICGPECIDSIDVTRLFPNTKNEAIIYWADSAYHKKISFINSYAEGADWHTADGLKIGAAAADLLKLNGKAIQFSGFGWDYGGTIISYNNGKFEKSSVHFELDKKYVEGDTSMALLGDQEFSTESPEAKKEMDKIYIRKISLSFYKE